MAAFEGDKNASGPPAPLPVATFTHITLSIAYCIVITVTLFHYLATYLDVASLAFFKRGFRTQTTKDHEEGTRDTKVLIPESVDGAADYKKANGEVKTDLSHGVAIDVVKAQDGQDPTDSGGGQKSAPAISPQPPMPSFEKALRSSLIFGIIMTFFYMCDFAHVIPEGDRTYSRDVFLFLVFLLFLVGSAFTVKKNPERILNRDQTEEWKGWMQVMFVWYHYYRAKEWYNWIRVYIACYVWMTGFGNFSFFWIRKDYSLWRVTKMLFRLNFLVIFVVMVTNNEYMLYYICAMHTYWFLSVYAFMAVLSSWNTQPYKMAFKFAVYAVCNAVIFDVPGVAEVAFRPLTFVLGYHDSTGSPLHEWSFRAGLDHWVCFVGMLCAYNYPHFEALMKYLESSSLTSGEALKKACVRVAMATASVLVGVVWYFSFMREEKYAYNKLHPYSSPLPILCFIVLRNIHPVLRTYHVELFSWLGKITLETYLSQLHVYLAGNATTLLVYLDGLPLLNFSLATIIYLAISHTLFNITNDASNFLLPKNYRILARNFGGFCLLFIASSALAFCLWI